MRRALLVIDMLNDFIEGGAPLEVKGARRIISKIKSFIGDAREKDIPIIFICDSHRKSDPEFRLKIWPPHAVKGTRGARVIDELKPQPGDHIVRKRTYSGFFKTRLERLLKRLKVKELILTGVCTDICILYTAADSVMRGFQVVVPKDAVCALTKEAHNFALKETENVLKARVE